MQASFRWTDDGGWNGFVTIPDSPFAMPDKCQTAAPAVIPAKAGMTAGYTKHSLLQAGGHDNSIRFYSSANREKPESTAHPAAFLDRSLCQNNAKA